MKLWILTMICLISSGTCQHNPGHHEDECDICTDDFEGFGTPASECGCCPWPCCCKCFNITTGPVEECDRLIDLCFILDESGSIGPADWADTLSFVNRIIAMLSDVGGDQLVAMVTFTTNATLHWDFNSMPANINEAISSLPIKGRYTNTVEGMEVAVKEVFVSSGGDRVGITNVCIVITDGRNNLRENEFDDMAMQLQDATDKVIVVGVTDKVDPEQLETIAGGPEHVYTVDQFNELINLLDELHHEICPPPPVEEKCFCCCTPEQFFGGGGAYYYMH